MRFLIDTQCWLWAYSARERLNDTAWKQMRSGENIVIFSAVSVAEIAIKARVGKLTLPSPAKEFFATKIPESSVSTLPLYVHHALRVAEMPLHHRDPFDRLLVAQAQAEGLPLMTADPKLAKYDVEIIWAGKEPPPA